MFSVILLNLLQPDNSALNVENCRYFGLCPGGIPSSKFSEHQTLDSDETLLQTRTSTSDGHLVEMVIEEQLTHAIQ